jgi:hypothetical protein
MTWTSFEAMADHSITADREKATYILALQAQGQLSRQIQLRKDSLTQRWKTIHGCDMLRVFVT